MGKDRQGACHGLWGGSWPGLLGEITDSRLANCRISNAERTSENIYSHRPYTLIYQRRHRTRLTEVGELVWCHTARARPQAPDPCWSLNVSLCPLPLVVPKGKFLCEYSRKPVQPEVTLLSAWTLIHPSTQMWSLSPFAAFHQSEGGIWGDQGEHSGVAHRDGPAADQRGALLRERCRRQDAPAERKPASLTPLEITHLRRGEPAKYGCHLIPWEQIPKLLKQPGRTHLCTAGCSRARILFLAPTSRWNGALFLFVVYNQGENTL